MAEADRTHRWPPTLALISGVLVVAVGLLVGLRPLRDNSFLTHLATGRLILERSSVPTTDPYSFTAVGEPWVVQSWLVSAVYASAERLGGLEAVRLLVGGIAATVAGLGWALLRGADGLVARLGLASLFLAVGAGTWAERPLMIGLIAFATVVLTGEGRLDARWLVPIGWIWVNSHGSFPLGLVYLVLVAVGSRLDGDGWASEGRALRWLGLGVGLGMVSPLGPRLLLFPVELLQRQELLSNVVEWQAPAFTTLHERAFLVQVAIAIVLLARRPRYRSALVTAAFVGAALLGARNIAVASIALLPSMASAAAGVGTLSASARPRRGLVLLALALATSGLGVVGRLQQVPLELRAYPVSVLAYLEANDVDTREVRLAGPEVVGNLLTYVYGDDRRVFYDDRFDMYPPEVSDAQLALVQAQPQMLDELDAFDIDLVTVRRASPAATVLLSDPGWRMALDDGRWVLACRRDAEVGGSFGTC